MKRAIFILLLVLGVVPFIKGQEANNQETGKIYFLRSTGIVGFVTGFNMFINGEFVCKLNNKKYSVHEVAAGTHTCAIQFTGKKLKKGTEQIEVTVASGQNVYINVVLESYAYTSFSHCEGYCEEISEIIAKEKMKNLAEDTNCQ